MPNGTIGDHPFTDIIIHKQDVYSSRAANLVREIDKLADDKTRRELGDLLLGSYNVHFRPDVPKLERVLTEMRDRLLKEARERGFEI